ncbi:MAG: arylsulfatase [Rhodospirillaceae bacterium]|nr:arylsulfatase [Rhodospirillaceae bacterium]
MIRSLFCFCLLLPPMLSAQAVRPNFLIIVADDVGMAELGPYGSEIDTPALDALAEEGIRFTSFYAQMNCSPTRAMLLSGMDNHLAGLGTMGAGMQSPNQEGVPGYEGVLSDRVVTFARLLKDSGYRTYATGKWHLGDAPDKLPVARGFDRSFIQTGGDPAGSHFNLDRRPGGMGGYFEDETDVTGMPVAEGFFSSDFYVEKLIDYMRGDPEQDKPFLAYLNFTAPHIPVQAPDTHIDLYRGRYDDGYDVLRETRLAGMIEMGLFPPGTEPGERAPTVTPWDALSEAARRIQARRMEVYAGAIDNMDDNIGKVIEYLKRADLYENTVILFMSDNGAAGFFGYESGPPAERYAAADNSIENLGRDGSVMFYGPGWGSAGSVPFNLFKRHAAEGGIRVPAIVSGPGVSAGGAISRSVLMVSDVAPTVLELAGVEYPQGIFDGREVLPQTGKSFVPLLRDPQTVIHGDDEVLGLELWGRISVRKGDWKLLKTEPPFRQDRWYLYNVRNDPGETTDLASQIPGKLEEMEAAWEQFRERSNVLLPQSLPDRIRPMWLIDDSPHPDPMP